MIFRLSVILLWGGQWPSPSLLLLFPGSPFLFPDILLINFHLKVTNLLGRIKIWMDMEKNSTAYEFLFICHGYRLSITSGQLLAVCQPVYFIKLITVSKCLILWRHSILIYEFVPEHLILRVYDFLWRVSFPSNINEKSKRK